MKKLRPNTRITLESGEILETSVNNVNASVYWENPHTAQGERTSEQVMLTFQQGHFVRQL